MALGSTIPYLLLMDSANRSINFATDPGWRHIMQGLAKRYGAKIGLRYTEKFKYVKYALAAWAITQGNPAQAMSEATGFSLEGCQEILNGTARIGATWTPDQTVDVARFADNSTIARGEMLQIGKAKLVRDNQGSRYVVESIFYAQVLEIRSEQNTGTFSLIFQNPNGVEKIGRTVTTRPGYGIYEIGDVYRTLNQN